MACDSRALDDDTRLCVFRSIMEDMRDRRQFISMFNNSFYSRLYQFAECEKIEKYILDIVFATREPKNFGLEDLEGMISFGASPRASISLALAARSYAFIKHRGYVIPEDVRAVCHDVLRHRIGISYEAEANNLTSEEIISEILNKVEVP